jgi:hypothetical protein
LNGVARGSLRSSAFVDTVDHVLEPGAYVRAIVPFVDDLERVFQKKKRAFDGPVILRTAGIQTGEHMVTPEQKNAAGARADYVLHDTG